MPIKKMSSLSIDEHIEVIVNLRRGDVKNMLKAGKHMLAVRSSGVSIDEIAYRSGHTTAAVRDYSSLAEAVQDKLLTQAEIISIGPSKARAVIKWMRQGSPKPDLDWVKLATLDDLKNNHGITVRQKVVTLKVAVPTEQANDVSRALRLFGESMRGTVVVGRSDALVTMARWVLQEHQNKNPQLYGKTKAQVQHAIHAAE